MILVCFDRMLWPHNLLRVCTGSVYYEIIILRRAVAKSRLRDVICRAYSDTNQFMSLGICVSINVP